MAEPILVFNDLENETYRATNILKSKREMVISRMTIIDNYRINKSLDKQAMQFLVQKTRESTQRAYDNSWNQWLSWYNPNNKDPYHYNPKNVLAFLITNQQYSNAS